MLLAASCGSDRPEETVTQTSEVCAAQSLSGVGSSGEAQIFFPDPRVNSNNKNLLPTATDLDSFRQPVRLERLTGKGVLEGSYVDVRNQAQCNGNHGAFNDKNVFSYSQADFRFQETMSYHIGDQYFSFLEKTTGLIPKQAFRIYAHCSYFDNAYYSRRVETDGSISEYACIGDSTITPGASYADDGMVLVHELQHGTTVNAYSLIDDINSLWFDEAGALGEAVSDFVSLIFFAPVIPSDFDPRTFSRWALETFTAKYSIENRGAHRCPSYDSSFSSGCGSFSSDVVTNPRGFSSQNNTISYSSPDGLGWPHANNYQAPYYVRSAFYSNRHQEEIHHTGAILTGALWEIFEELKINHSNDSFAASSLLMKLVVEAIKHLPNPSPQITLIGYAKNLVDYALTVGLSETDKQSIINILQERGLYRFEPISKGWATAQGLKIIDNPAVLAAWTGPGVIPQTATGNINDKFDPGEIDAVWFNISNKALRTAGGLLLTITSENPKITFLGSGYNPGIIDSLNTQVRYSKINGSAIVDALNADTTPSSSIGVETTYLTTNPFAPTKYTTAVWLKIDPTATSGETVRFIIDVTAANSQKDSRGNPVIETIYFTTTIN